MISNRIHLPTPKASNRGNIDDNALATFEHMPSNTLRHQERASDIRIENLLPSFQRHTFGRCTPRQTSIVDQYINLATFFKYLLYCLLHYRTIRDITG